MFAHLLAFDTSTESLAVALQGRAQAWHINDVGGALASAHLLPRINALMASAALRFDELDAIAFGCGPGAFTGLRTSCAVAQGLGFGASLPVLAVDSLLIVAEDARQQVGAAVVNQALDVAVAMDARMDEAYAAVYRWQAGVWHTLQSPLLYTLPALVDAWRPLDVQLVAGSALAAFGERLVLPASQRLPDQKNRAQALLTVAQQLWRSGAATSAEHALPLYLRDKVAQTTLEREAARAAKTLQPAQPAQPAQAAQAAPHTPATPALPVAHLHAPP